MNLNELRIEVFRRTGINIEIDDPFYAGATLLSLMADEISSSNAHAINNIQRSLSHLSDHQTQFLCDQRVLLTNATTEIQNSVGRVLEMRNGMELAAANKAQQILLGDDGPIKKLNAIVRQEQEALGWLSRAANFYTRATISGLLPMYGISVLSSLAAGLVIKYM